MNILLFEDSFARHRDLAIRLQARGFVVESAKHPFGDYANLVHQSWEAILINCEDQIRVVQMLRAKINYDPILVISGTNLPEERIAILQAGADDCMDNSYDFEELVARIRAVARRGIDKRTL